MITCHLSRAITQRTSAKSHPGSGEFSLELAEHDIALTWKPAVEMVHVDAMSRNPVDPAEDMGPDPIDDQHQRLQDTINYIEEADDDEDHEDNI